MTDKKEKKINIFCLLAAVLAVFLAAGLTVGTVIFATPAEKTKGNATFLSTEYVSRIFDDSYVHEIDILLPEINWEYMVKFAMDEQYVICDVLIDGELFEDAAIRPKGNSSLKAISMQESDRFSFKLEFDHYHDNATYYGLDKLSLNNLSQDVSCLKDYLTYHMMNAADVPAPLSSYTLLKVNGKTLGLYLAVEAVEDSFALRNYGEDFGNIYKPECFEISTVTPKAFLNTDMTELPDYTSLQRGDRVDFLGQFIRKPFEMSFGEKMEAAALKYLGEDPAKYQVFYDSTVFDLTEEDKISLISAVRTLNINPEFAVDYDSVIPFFVVHGFVNNYDSYSGIFVHNYYLREMDGKLSMIPWDYNLAFGIFTMETALKSILRDSPAYDVALETGEAMDDKTSMVNYPIDTPTFTVSVEERPLLSAVLNDTEKRRIYHETYAGFLDSFFASGQFEELFMSAVENISHYVADGMTFYTREQFETAVRAVHDYCLLREESIRRQLDGKLPATMSGQIEDYTYLVDASALDLASTVTFDGLIFGIRNEDIWEVLDAVAGEHPHDTAGLTEAITEIAEHPGGQIGKAAGRILTQSGFLKRALRSALRGPLLLIIAFVIIIIMRKRVIKFRRRRR